MCILIVSFLDINNIQCMFMVWARVNISFCKKATSIIYYVVFTLAKS